MPLRNLADIFDSPKKANQAILICIIMNLLYKGWKWFLREQMNLHPLQDYLTYEICSTVFRYLGAFVCLISAYHLYANRDHLYKAHSRNIYLPLILFPLGYFLIKSQQQVVSFSPIVFLQELPINFAVGFWEEGSFRALLFAGLCRYISLPWAVIVSGILFSAYHFDVHSHASAYEEIFLISGCLSLFYVLGASILQLSLLHFVWDQMVFGLVWERGRLGYTLQLYELFFSIVLSIMVYRKTQLTKRPKWRR